MDGGHVIAETLKNAGSKAVFTLCGGHVMNIYDGCIDRGIPTIDVRHEQAAVMAADGVARLTGEPGVAIVTAGPGVTNAITGLENAHRCDSPIVTMGGQGPLEAIDKGSLQESDHLGFVKAVTKWCRRVHQTNRLGDYVERAFRQATSLPSGPAYLELPWDVLFGETAEAPAARVQTRAPRQLADPAAVREALELVEGAERPVLMAAGGVRWGGATATLRDLVELTGIAAFQNGLGRGSFPKGFPNAYHLCRGAAFKQADLVLNVTAPWDFRMGFGDKLAEDVKIVHVAETGDRAGENRACDVPLVGHTGAVLEQLLAEAKGREFPDWGDWHATLAEAEAAKAEGLTFGEATGERATSLGLVHALAPYVEDGVLFIGDGGNIVATAGKVLKPTEPENWLDPGPFGCLGVGPPFALAAGVVRPGETPLVLMGDGAFGLNGFEIETLARHNMPAVFVVGNDAAWNQIRVPQIMYYGKERAVATGLAFTRYDRIAEGMGAKGVHVTSGADLEAALESAFKTAAGERVPVVLNVEVDPASNQGTGGYPA